MLHFMLQLHCDHDTSLVIYLTFELIHLKSTFENLVN